MPEIKPTEYKLVSPKTGRAFDDQLQLDCPDCSSPAFLRARYAKKQLEVGPDELGLYKFADWLPVHRALEGSGAPISYKAEKLGSRLGLEHLYVTFSGWWPEKGAAMRTGTFKECEAYSVCARIPEGYPETLVVASAGNTARSFAQVCSENELPLVVVIPEEYLAALWFDRPLGPSVKIVAAGAGSDYFDAIKLSGFITAMDGFFPEGGAKNVARRDGMGTTTLSAATTIGRIPDAYFQAVGSGTGAIAAWEASLRLKEDGRFGTGPMRLYISQNDPFLLLYESWKRGGRKLVEIDEATLRRQLAAIDAKVLSNRQPPYSIGGGLYDALTESGGDVIPATNEEAREAISLFQEVEGIDITPSAGVALASLKKALASGQVKADQTIMLNITGGGCKRYRQDREIHYAQPDLVIPQERINAETVQQEVSALYNR